MEIVTGSTGQVHVTPIDDAVRNSNVGYLNGKAVFTCFDNFAATVITNNEVRISSGYGINQGRIFKIDDQEYDSVTIENGSQGYKRADLIVARYTMDMQTGFEDISLAVIRGNSGSTYIDPSYSTGDINGGNTQDDFPLYRVKLNGLTIEAVEAMFTLVPDGGRLGELEAQVRAHKTAFDALNIKTNLASESSVYLKNGANARPGVEGILPVNHGGTGKANLKDSATDLIGALDTNAITPSASDTDYYVGTTPNTQGYQRKPLSALWAWLEAKISNLGYGDMIKEFFCDNPDSEIPTIKQSRGGTGSRDGSINGVKLGTSGNTKGYYDANGNFKSFRQPTGNAAVGDVLSGKTFANASNDALTGSMPNRGSATRSINAGSTSSVSAGYYSGGTITANRYHDDNTYTFGSNNGATVDLGQAHNYRRVNATNVYNKGVSDQKAVYWDETYEFTPDMALYLRIPLRSVIGWKLNRTGVSGLSMTYNSNITITGDLTQWHDISTNTTYKDIRITAIQTNSIEIIVRRVAKNKW